MSSRKTLEYMFNIKLVSSAGYKQVLFEFPEFSWQGLKKKKKTRVVN